MMASETVVDNVDEDGDSKSKGVTYPWKCLFLVSVMLCCLDMRGRRT